MTLIPIIIDGRELKPHKAIISPILTSRTVLTNSHWEFVSLWLKRNNKTNALFYWNQANEFHKASLNLPIQSAPLLHYYSFMNAAKALLSTKNIKFSQHHGVKGDKLNKSRTKINLNNERVEISNNNEIFPSLSLYYQETETNRVHSLQELLFNLPYIHRTYCLTYISQKDMYIPLINCKYMGDKATNEVYLTAKLSKNFDKTSIIKRLPNSFKIDNLNGENFIKSVKSVSLSKLKNPTPTDINKIVDLQKIIRIDLSYINGAETLWYIKAITPGPSRILRFPTTITLAVMHRLSELCRYHPVELESFLSSQKNWLLSEFIQQSPLQFIDEISAEITGHQFMVPNVRPAS